MTVKIYLNKQLPFGLVADIKTFVKEMFLTNPNFQNKTFEILPDNYMWIDKSNIEYEDHYYLYNEIHKFIFNELQNRKSSN